MKKLITILAIAAITLTSTFAVTTSFDGSAEKAPEMNVTLKSSLEQTNYDLSLLYGKIDFTNEAQQTIDGLDLTEKGSTDEFNVMITNGNLNKTITFVTEITEKPFVGLVDGEDYTTENNLRVLNAEGDNQTSYSSKIKAGPQESQSVATFLFNWDADKALPAGDYATTNTISISVN
jgi:hypothetical protein